MAASMFWCHSDTLVPLYGETLAPLEQIVHIVDRSPERVAMCNSLLVCVRVDTRKSQDNGMTQLFTRFPPVSLFREFRASSSCKLERERERERSMPVKLRTDRVGGLWLLQALSHLCTHGMASPSFRSRSNASEPLYGETLAPLEQS